MDLEALKSNQSNIYHIQQKSRKLSSRTASRIPFNRTTKRQNIDIVPRFSKANTSGRSRLDRVWFYSLVFQLLDERTLTDMNLLLLDDVHG